MSHSIEKRKLFRIFIGESDRYKDKPLHIAIIELCRERDIAGATVLRGVAGYGHHNILHTDRVLRLSGDLPLIVEIVDSEENLMKILPLLREMAADGLITMENIEVVKHLTGRDEGSRES
jgi:hypothetical protein